MPGAALLGGLSNKGIESGKELFWLFMCQAPVLGVCRKRLQCASDVVLLLSVNRCSCLRFSVLLKRSPKQTYAISSLGEYCENLQS